MAGSARRTRVVRLVALAVGAVLLSGLGGCVVSGGYGSVIWRIGYGYGCH